MRVTIGKIEIEKQDKDGTAWKNTWDVSFEGQMIGWVSGNGSELYQYAISTKESDLAVQESKLDILKFVSSYKAMNS